MSRIFALYGGFPSLIKHPCAVCFTPFRRKKTAPAKPSSRLAGAVLQDILVKGTGKDYLLLCPSVWRSSTRRIFPEMVLGSSFTNSTTRGYL